MTEILKPDSGASFTTLDEAHSRVLKELADIKYALDEAAIVAITDAKGKITYINDYFCEISKYSREELMGQDHRIINSHFHSKEFFRDMWSTIGKGKVWKGEIKNRAKDGTFYWVETTIVPFIDENTGKPYQYVAIRQDITYLKRIENELRLLNDELEQRVEERTAELEKSNQELMGALNKLMESERMRETFVSALTHDLRTPLVAAQRTLELMQNPSSGLNEKFIPIVGRLIHNNTDLLEMVNKLLETYQFEAGKIRLIPEQVNVHNLVHRVFEQLSNLADSKDIRLVNAIPAEGPIIRADSHQIRRVLTNLVGNALEHIESGCEVTVTTTFDEKQIEICVSDNGPGIPNDILPFLFDRYFAQQTRKKIGSGLGLSICRMIARLHGGDMRVDSKLGEGTQFYVCLPIELKESHD